MTSTKSIGLRKQKIGFILLLLCYYSIVIAVVYIYNLLTYLRTYMGYNCDIDEEYGLQEV